MRIWLLTAALAMAGSSTVFARDWSGFYFGSYITYSDYAGSDSTSGFDSSFSDWDVDPDPFVTPQDVLSGFSASDWMVVMEAESGNPDHGAGYGFQLGWNWQSGMWVVGVEADISSPGIGGDAISMMVADDLSGSAAIMLSETSLDIGALQVLRVRGGRAIGPLLLFASAGAARAEVSFASLVFSQVVRDGSTAEFLGDFYGKDDLVGWTVGMGAEYAFAENMSVKLEYQHVDLGSLDLEVCVCTDPTASPQADISLNTVKLGLSSRF